MRSPLGGDATQERSVNYNESKRQYGVQDPRSLPNDSPSPTDSSKARRFLEIRNYNLFHTMSVVVVCFDVVFEYTVTVVLNLRSIVYVYALRIWMYNY